MPPAPRPWRCRPAANPPGSGGGGRTPPGARGARPSRRGDPAAAGRARTSRRRRAARDRPGRSAGGGTARSAGPSTAPPGASRRWSASARRYTSAPTRRHGPSSTTHVVPAPPRLVGGEAFGREPVAAEAADVVVAREDDQRQAVRGQQLPYKSASSASSGSSAVMSPVCTTRSGGSAYSDQPGEDGPHVGHGVARTGERCVSEIWTTRRVWWGSGTVSARRERRRGGGPARAERTGVPGLTRTKRCPLRSSVCAVRPGPRRRLPGWWSSPGHRPRWCWSASGELGPSRAGDLRRSGPVARRTWPAGPTCSQLGHVFGRVSEVILGHRLLHARSGVSRRVRSWPGSTRPR